MRNYEEAECQAGDEIDGDDDKIDGDDDDDD